MCTWPWLRLVMQEHGATMTYDLLVPQITWAKEIHLTRSCNSHMDGWKDSRGGLRLKAALNTEKLHQQTSLEALQCKKEIKLIHSRCQTFGIFNMNEIGLLCNLKPNSALATHYLYRRKNLKEISQLHWPLIMMVSLCCLILLLKFCEA